jgi:hypothetical protein
MELRKERIIAYWIAIVLFVVGVVCYAAFPQKTPEQPLRIMLENTGGNVLFDHRGHASEDGYGIECDSCHHDIEEKGDKPQACGECHLTEADDSPKRSDAFHKQCKGCHEEDGTAPVKCSGCHVL